MRALYAKCISFIVAEIKHNKIIFRIERTAHLTSNSPFSIDSYFANKIIKLNECLGRDTYTIIFILYYVHVNLCFTRIISQCQVRYFSLTRKINNKKIKLNAFCVLCRSNALKMELIADKLDVECRSNHSTNWIRYYEMAS